MAPVQVELWIAGQKAHEVVRFAVERELGRPPRATVEARLLSYVEPRALLGQSGILYFRQGGVDQQLHGVILSAAAIATTGKGSDHEWEIEIELVSLLGSLAHSVTSRIFQDLSVPDIVKAVLAEHDIPDSVQTWRLSGTYPPREYCVQYAESALDFINRLLEKEGIFYSFRAGDDAEQVVFEDDSTGCDPIDGDGTVRYVAASGARQADEVIQSIADTHRVQSGKVVLRDYDFKRPDLDLTAEAEAELDTDLALFDYPGGYVEPAEGKRYAKVQLQADQARCHTLAVSGNCARLIEGRKLTLADAPRGLDGDYVVTRVAHRYLALGEGEPSFTMEADLLPADVPFRRRATTPRPVIDGPQTATVVAPEGAEPEAIHCDEHGRCKVKFHWDLDEARDDKASCWIRTQQLQTSGSMVLPRVDWEVIVEFEYGDPDRPIVTGRLFNGRYPPPYELPKGKTRTALRSASSPGGAGTNEIRLEDTAGSEEISVKAEKNLTQATGNNKTKSTGTDETQSVAANRTLTVGANQTIRVTSGYQNAVTGAQTQVIGGSRDVGVDAVLGLSAPSLTGSVGGNQFEMDGNPLAGLIDLAAEKVKEKAKEKAAEKMKELDGAVKDKVDKVMGPVNELKGKLDNVQKGFEAAKNGDLSGTADAAREAAGLPTPGEFANDLKDQAVGKATDKLNQIPGSQFAKEGAKAAGLTGDDEKGKGDDGGKGKDGGGDAKGKGGGEGGGDKGFVDQVQDKGFSAASGLDKMVNKGIDDAVGGAAGGLKDALGVGQGGKVVPGPPGGVSGNAAADNTCGPGHSVHKVTSTFDETIGSIRATIAVGDINTNVGGARTQDIGAARVELVKGVRAESCATKTEEAVGLVVLASGDEGESVGAAKTQNIGGALLAKVGSDAKVAAGGPASFVGALHKVTASGKITFNCGGSSVIIDGGGITIKSPAVNIAAASVKLTKAVDEGPGGGAGGGGGAGPGDASGGGAGGGGGPEGGSGGGGGGGASTGGSGQDKGKADARAKGADQSKDKGKWPPNGSTRGDPPPSKEKRDLAASKNTDPDDGKNDARREARKECLQHYTDNEHKVTTHKKGPDGKVTSTTAPPNEKQAQGLKDDFDLDKPVNYTTSDDELPGGQKKGASVNGSYGNKGEGDDVPDGWPWTAVPGKDDKDKNKGGS